MTLTSYTGGSSEVFRDTSAQSGSRPGAPKVEYAPPSPVTYPRLLSVLVRDSIAMSSGDVQKTTLLAPTYSDSFSAGAEWTNTSGGYSDDGLAAAVTLSASATSQDFSLQGYDLSSIPDDADILGVEIYAKVKKVGGQVASVDTVLQACSFGAAILDYTSDAYWSSANATWDGTKWVADTPANGIVLTPTGLINIQAFRDSHPMAVTLTLSGSGGYATVQFNAAADISNSPHLNEGASGEYKFDNDGGLFPICTFTPFDQLGIVNTDGVTEISKIEFAEDFADFSDITATLSDNCF